MGLSTSVEGEGSVTIIVKCTGISMAHNLTKKLQIYL